MNARRLLVWVLIVGGILLAAVVGSRRADQGLPLDPSSPGPNGTKALVETLRVLGAKVSVSSELPSDGGTALLLADDLSEQRRARLLDWIRHARCRPCGTCAGCPRRAVSSSGCPRVRRAASLEATAPGWWSSQPAAARWCGSGVPAPWSTSGSTGRTTPC